MARIVVHTSIVKGLSPAGRIEEDWFGFSSTHDVPLLPPARRMAVLSLMNVTELELSVPVKSAPPTLSA